MRYLLAYALAGAAVAAILMIETAVAQEDDGQKSEPQAEPQCVQSGSPWRDFDFWVGNWEVFDPVSGRKVGDNEVELLEGGCLIMERWLSLDGVSGVSMNFFDPLSERWRQIWQNAGIFVDMSGGMDEAGRMVLEGTVFYHAQGTHAPFRGRWTRQAENQVLQEFWQFDPQSEAWQPWFIGEYGRK